MNAVISPCGKYRYWLRRDAEVMRPERSAAFFVMLNPSTADASIDDPTIRRCRGFARTWGCNGLVVANLYSFRATSPKELWRDDVDPVGIDGDYWLRRLLGEHKDVVCAWGAHAKPDRVDLFREIAAAAGANLYCLGTTKAGAPRHPLYIKADTELTKWKVQDE